MLKSSRAVLYSNSNETSGLVLVSHVPLRPDLNRRRGGTGRCPRRGQNCIRQVIGEGVVEQEFLSVGADELVGPGVEVEAAGERHGGDEFGRRDEGVRGGVGVVAADEVPVVRGHDGVLLALLRVLPVPLPDARPAGVSEHDAAELPRGLGDIVALDGGADLFGAGRDHEERLGLQAVLHRLLHYGGAAAHILVGAVGTGPDEAGLHLQGPALLAGSDTDLVDGVGQVGGEGAVDVGLEGVQVDLCALGKEKKHEPYGKDPPRWIYHLHNFMMRV